MSWLFLTLILLTYSVHCVEGRVSSPSSGSETTNICSRNGLKLPHPHDCSQYYHCTGNEANPEPLGCGGGRLFDINSNQCKPAFDAVCIASSFQGTSVMSQQETVAPTATKMVTMTSSEHAASTSTVTAEYPSTTTESPTITPNDPLIIISATPTATIEDENVPTSAQAAISTTTRNPWEATSSTAARMLTTNPPELNQTIEIGKCLDLDDSSGYWNNLTDLNSSSCVTTPRTDQAKPLLKMRLNLTCLSAMNIEFNQTHPSLTVHLLANLTQCDEEMFFFTKKLTRCDREAVKDCVVRSIGVDSGGVCEFMCECEPVLDTCHMYLAQRLDPPYFSTAINLCDINLSRIY